MRFKLPAAAARRSGYGGGGVARRDGCWAGGKGVGVGGGDRRLSCCKEDCIGCLIWGYPLC